MDDDSDGSSVCHVSGMVSPFGVSSFTQGFDDSFHHRSHTLWDVCVLSHGDILVATNVHDRKENGHGGNIRWLGAIGNRGGMVPASKMVAGYQYCGDIDGSCMGYWIHVERGIGQSKDTSDVGGPCNIVLDVSVGVQNLSNRSIHIYRELDCRRSGVYLGGSRKMVSGKV